MFHDYQMVFISIMLDLRYDLKPSVGARLRTLVLSTLTKVIDWALCIEEEFFLV